MLLSLHKIIAHPRFAYVMAVLLLGTVTLLIALAGFALTGSSVAPPYPDASKIVEEQSFGEYIGLVELTFDFLTKVIGVLIAALLLIIVLLGVQLYLWNQDRRKLTKWRETGLVVERIEFLAGNRLRINNIELN